MSAAGVVCRASAGASEICPMFVEGEEHTIVPTMHALGVKIVSCDIKNSIPIGEADLRKPLLLAVGGEKRGLSREILDASESIVRLEYGRVFPQALSMRLPRRSPDTKFSGRTNNFQKSRNLSGFFSSNRIAIESIRTYSNERQGTDHDRENRPVIP